MDNASKNNPRPDRKLGDEWADWDGSSEQLSSDTNARVFIGLAMTAIIVILGATALFGWLISPRLSQMGHIYGTLFNILYLGLSAVLVLWLALFIWGAVTRRPFLSTFIIVPKLINLLLDLTLRIGKLTGISPDKMFNSFLKLHNLIISSDPIKVSPDRMLILLPRCLTKDSNAHLRNMRDKYGFEMATAGGGGEARKKIRQIRPRLILAVACERDLLTGFIEINPHVPVIGFPNIRPSGPCKNTEVDLTAIEMTVKRHILTENV